MLDFTSFFFFLILIDEYEFGGCIENLQGKYFLVFFTTDAGDFT